MSAVAKDTVWPVNVAELPTPALLVDEAALADNISAMSAVLPGERLRPHVKAFKSTALAARLADAGHQLFCCATIAEMEGMAAAGLGHDLLLANEVLDARRLGALSDQARITVAVDSDVTLKAAIDGGVKNVLIDVNVGLPRCGCHVSDAGRLADAARAAGLEVRGVMGYEGHLMDLTDRDQQRTGVAKSMAVLAEAHAAVGGDIVSAGGTGTFDINEVATEIQAGSYMLMDTHYAKVGLPFRRALSVLTQVISVSSPASGADNFVVVNGGLKALGMDHGNPTVDGATVFFCSDEHTTLIPEEGSSFEVGELVRLWPAHVDPTVAKHRSMHVVDGDTVIDEYAIDLRHW